MDINYAKVAEVLDMSDKSAHKIEDLDKLKAQHNTANGLLREVEWAGHPEIDQCPMCFAVRTEGHSSTCALATHLSGAPADLPQSLERELLERIQALRDKVGEIMLSDHIELVRIDCLHTEVLSFCAEAAALLGKE